MKRPITIYDLRFTIWKKSAKPAANRQLAIDNRQSQNGVALIITLIMLSVVTFMALTFLAISRRERGAVTTTTDQNTANNAAAAALAGAEAQIMANALATTNPYNFGLLVSTNYINPIGFQTAASVYANPTNINYYYTDGTPVTNLDDFLQLLANLEYLPRAPVLISSNDPVQGRFFLNLNRNVDISGNAVFDTNNFPPGAYTNGAGPAGDPEWIGVLQHPDQPYGPDNPFVARYAFVAVPIGNALDLNAIHNQAMTKAVEQTNGSLPAGIAGDGYFRNQGVGSWEINLAAFLADLNTNEWLPVLPPANLYYAYYPPPAVGGNKGIAFEDALALLSYRYGYNYNSLAPVGGNAPPGLFTTFNAFPPFQNNIDAYSDGPLMTTLDGINDNGQDVTFRWAGADNPTNFFDPQELFDPNKTSPAFTNRLQAAGNSFILGNNSGDPTNFYNRYTYYRLLAQMGVESAPEQNQINLNYSNAFAYTNLYGVVTNITIFPGAETNFIPWTASNFFLIAADRMLRAYSQEWLTENPSNYVATYGMTTNISTAPNPVLNFTNVPVPFGVSDIPVLINGQFVYTPAVQRVLQLAANIYDATTNSFYPSVFRPTFWVTNDPVTHFDNVYINGYQQVLSVPNGTGDPQLALPVDVTSLSPGSYYGLNCSNVYGVPWIIGAKKGFPNFNEFSMENVVQITRKLEITRPTLDAPLSEYQTNQMYIFSFTNYLGVECWNSYGSNYLDPVTIWVRDTNTMTLTNGNGVSGIFPLTRSFLTANLTNVNPWPGTLESLDGYWWNGNVTPNQPNPASFVIPLYTNVVLYTGSIYTYFPPGFRSADTNYVETGILPLPQLGLQTTNRLQVVMLDNNTNVIDYVQLNGPNSARNLNVELADPYDPAGTNCYMWSTNLADNGLSPSTPYGVYNQIAVSQGLSPVPSADGGLWDNTYAPTEIPHFKAFFSPNHYVTTNVVINGIETTNYVTNTDLSVQVPFTPTRTIYEYTTLQANDPLVHYLVSDLNFSGTDNNGIRTGTNQINPPQSLPNLYGTNLYGVYLGNLSVRYQPWGISAQMSQPANVDANPFNLAFRDPLIYASDDWDFPTNKFPTIGWLGRVHRGTPWQTVCLKSTNILAEANSASPNIGVNTWVTWTGDGNAYDAVNSAPVQDRLLFDLFTTAPNDNATRGQLSVNVAATDPSPQAGLAAWSALFSGVIVLTNTASDAVAQMNLSLFPRSPLSTVYFPVNPAGPAGVNSALGQIVTNINQIRATFTNMDGLVGSFEHVGDILAVPQLSDQSSFLNTNGVQRQYGISDEMYEWLPQQVMSLLRVSGTPQSPMRYVIYSYGQALKPAPDGIYSGSGQFFGMVTNYQVVAESAARAVVNFNSVVTNIVSTNDAFGALYLLPRGMPVLTNNNAVIKRYNVLAPD